MADSENPRNCGTLIPAINSIPLNVNLRLRDDVLPHARRREFFFKGVAKSARLILAPESGIYTWEADVEDIDWQEYRERNRLRNAHC